LQLTVVKEHIAALHQRVIWFIMAVDYLSSLNVGSGLNITQIVDALVDAEKAPKEATLNSKVEEKTVSISSFAEVKQEFGTFGENLSLLSSFTGLVVQSSGTAVIPTVKDKSKVVPSSHILNVSQLATSQTIAFTGYSSETAAIDASGMTIDLGAWSSDLSSFTPSGTNRTLTFDGTETLADVRNEINGLGIGVTASIIRTSDNNYALTLRGPLGHDNQIRVQATPVATLAASALNFDPENTASDSLKQATAGTNAIVTIDGVQITRPTNKVDDVIAGVSLELKSVSTSTEVVSASYNEEMTREAIQLFVDEINSITNSLAEMNKTGTADETSGPLAGDTLVRSFRNQLRMITTTPITGFGDDDVFLSSFGVMTNRDGTLSLDEAKFKTYFATNPGGFAAIANSRVDTSSLSVKAEMTSNSYTPGNYQFIKNADGSATLSQIIKNNDGTTTVGTAEPMSLENGVYKITSGGARGVHITATGTSENATIYIGKSLFETLQDFTNSILKTNSDIDQKVARYSDDVTKYNEQLEDLNAKMEAQRLLYTERFTAMETAVSSFKETSTLLDNFMESWRASLK
jgi:flagellar hook-associated protein 2